MSVKKLLLLCAAGLASAATIDAYAGGPDVAPAPSYAPSYEGIYIQGDLGYALSRWDEVVGYSASDSGSFTAGGAVGYQFTRYLAAEFGGFWIDRVRVATPVTLGRVRVTDWFLYLAGKLMAPLPWVDNLDVFFKAGGAYREVDPRGGPRVELWRPVFGGGLMYWVNENWYVKGQYLYVPGNSRFVSIFSSGVPALHLFTAGIGYKFAI